jgi:hypothetical protein
MPGALSPPSIIEAVSGRRSQDSECPPAGREATLLKFRKSGDIADRTLPMPDFDAHPASDTARMVLYSGITPTT